ncbi:MAG: hypothetical protein IMF06_07400 [Proteobacteria bacterium]|nr:hypothetical protein [Pseudomonadota bacterium]
MVGGLGQVFFAHFLIVLKTTRCQHDALARLYAQGFAVAHHFQADNFSTFLGTSLVILV